MGRQQVGMVWSNSVAMVLVLDDAIYEMSTQPSLYFARQLSNPMKRHTEDDTLH